MLSRLLDRLTYQGYKHPLTALLVIGLLLTSSIGMNVYFSPDACVTVTSPLRLAQNLLAGNGYWLIDASGQADFYTTYPVGYPTLVAAASVLTGFGVMLGSKVLNLFCVFTILFILYRFFGRDAWVFALVLLFGTFQMIFSHSWTEPVFLTGILLLLVFTTSYLHTQSNARLYLFGVGAGLVFIFLTRYVGAFMIVALGIIWLFKWYRQRKPDAAMGWTIFVSGCLCLFYMFYVFIEKGTFLTKGSISAKGIIQPVQSEAVLLENLFTALIKALSIPLVTKFSWLSIVAFSIVVQAGLFIWLKRTKGTHYLTGSMLKKPQVPLWPIAFMTSGIYLLVLISIRFYLALDDFGYRYLSPFTFTVAMGILDYCRNCKPFYFKLAGQWLILLGLAALALNGPLKHWHNRQIEKPPVSTYLENLEAFRHRYHFIADTPTTVAFGDPMLDYRYLNVATPSPLSIAPSPEKAQPMDEFLEALMRRKGQVYIAIQSIDYRKGPYQYHPSVREFMQAHQGQNFIRVK